MLPQLTRVTTESMKKVKPELMLDSKSFFSKATTCVEKTIRGKGNKTNSRITKTGVREVIGSIGTTREQKKLRNFQCFCYGAALT